MLPTERRRRAATRSGVAWLLLAGGAVTGNAWSAVPAWMRAAAAAPLPAHDEKTPAVVMYAETALTVQPDGRMVRLQRVAVRILRPEGEARGLVRIDYSPQSRVTKLRGWCLPAGGKEFEVREQDVVDAALAGVDGGDLVSDLRTKRLRIPAALAGNLVGYEYAQDVRPHFVSDEWEFQDTVPVAEARYSLQLPAGWSYRTTWLNSAGTAPQAAGPGSSVWTVRDVGAVRVEKHMPPLAGVSGRMVLALVPPTGEAQALLRWRDVSNWYLELARGRTESSPEMRQKVAALTAGQPSTLGRIRALAQFVQSEIRYVSIQLNNSGYQPHAATEVFAHRYGDCKDKATLLAAMLREIGIDSYIALINTVRGTVSADSPPNLGFNHAILAIRLPEDAGDPSLQTLLRHPALGRILFFDPTDELTPLGTLSGNLQASYALLAAPGDGLLVATPQLPAGSSGLRRTGRFTLDAAGMLRGELTEERLGDFAAAMRGALRSATVDTDRIRYLEFLVANSISTFRILQASIGNLNAPTKPVVWRYSIEAPGYAKANGDLLVVRPRILGVLSANFLEVPEPREHAIEIEGPERDSDELEIELPEGFAVEELPPPVDVELEFATYHSRSEVVGNVLRYTRTLEYRQLSIPASRAEALRGLYRTIQRDERALAVLGRSPAR